MELKSLVEIIIIAIGLAMDAFAVSISSGTIIRTMHLKHALRIALFFGFFQALMPIIGWFGGSLFAKKIESFDHWIAFILLSLIGLKMIKEAFDTDEEESFNPLNIYILFTLSIATSIDALAVGITFSVLNVTIWSAAAIIGLITFLISFVGVKLGKKLGDKVGNRVEIAGGTILILIGCKILIEHLFFQ